MSLIFVATSNAHKVAEIRAMLAPDHKVVSPLELGLQLGPEETGRTLAENAQIKAIAWAALLNTKPIALKIAWVLADDSGLEVDALHGAPGVHSARFAALDQGRPGNSSDAENNAKLMQLLAPVADAERTARFCCVIALKKMPGAAATAGFPEVIDIFTGRCDGRIQRVATGSSGFGYDPYFVPNGCVLSFAELGETIKNSVSHRAKALGQVVVFLRNAPPR